jgi:hypothetical protein
MRNDEGLPAFSPTCGFVATDVDLFIHRYLTEVDSVGTREIQGLMHIEVKTRSGDPGKSQLDTLYKINACRTQRAMPIGREVVRHFGVSIVKLSGLTPDDSAAIYWGRFVDGERRLAYRLIDLAMLRQLMRFEIHPDNFDVRPFRRHHCTRTVVQIVTTELGFECDELLTKSS